MHLVNIGYGNLAQAERIISVVAPEAAPIRRMVQDARDRGEVIDATCGHKTKAVLVMDSGHLVLSPLLPETIAGRTNPRKELSQA
ncbi:MAG: DUF370 domain-containing protein [Clostridia bacterium]|nr:DUF370 domain-containing protein [Clostridia bacterium]MBQ9252667.1 DUF370 domain-containing protein [Clostridia bacterium]